MSVRCGQILLVSYPFTDTSGSKIRPALVVSADAYNQGEDFVVIPFSTVPPPDDRWALTFRDTAPGFGQTGLRGTSYIRWTKPMTISEKVVARRLGSLPSKILSEVQVKLQGMFQM